jgi:hypothetical protein
VRFWVKCERSRLGKSSEAEACCSNASDSAGRVDCIFAIRSVMLGCESCASIRISMSLPTTICLVSESGSSGGNSEGSAGDSGI